jgi:ubiquinone/menaquinone biosynthesis C-methylase UbiE
MPGKQNKITPLKLKPVSFYKGVNSDDPIRYYYYPIFGHMYRRRVELCLNECKGGDKVLEIGFGTGLAFLNLAEKYKEIHGVDLTADVEIVDQTFQQIGLTTYLKNGDILELPYPDQTFDCVLLISILEHLQPGDQQKAFSEIARVLKPGGQVVYGVPIERPFMVSMFKLLGYDIREAHFSTEDDVSNAADTLLKRVRIIQMDSTPPWFGKVYVIGNYLK